MKSESNNRTEQLVGVGELKMDKLLYKIRGAQGGGGVTENPP